MNGKCRSFPFQFEDYHSRIMASCKNIKRWMWGHHPKSIMFSAEGMETSTFGHIPNTNRLVLRIRNNQILSRMKDHTRHIVVMSTTCVNFPRLWKNWENWNCKKIMQDTFEFNYVIRTRSYKYLTLILKVREKKGQHWELKKNLNSSNHREGIK